ncbi:MAG: HAD family hydrolase [Alphaproteobacteria bacterium]|nr:HAD family hydrolase [Alphaproteobacteria bacterium]
MKNKKLAVFDWNGTLLADTVICWKATQSSFAFYGLPPISLKKQRETFDFPIIRFYQRNGCDVDQILATKEQSWDIFQKDYEHLSAKARTRRGAKTLLDWLTKKDVTCIILSNYIDDKITPHLDRLNIRHYFSHVSANTRNGPSILDTMNKYERLSEFINTYNYHPDNTVIFGDSNEEPDIGRRLGVTSIGITNGCISEPRLRAAKPDHMISALPQAINVLKDQWKI